MEIIGLYQGLDMVHKMQVNNSLILPDSIFLYDLFIWSLSSYII